MILYALSGSNKLLILTFNLFDPGCMITVYINYQETWIIKSTWSGNIQRKLNKRLVDSDINIQEKVKI